MTRILFVCLGNICRSPLAEAILNQMIEQHGLEDLLTCDSCGTSSNHVGESPDKRTIAIADKYQVPVTHKARQLVAADFSRFDHILAMDESNLQHIQNMIRKSNPEPMPLIELMRPYEPGTSETSVPDPWFGDMRDFEYCYQLLNTCCEQLLKKYIV